ncbi:MAG TPA: hypothetical protein VFP77_12380 [Gemmatimonadaceae bacterium]|jgi:hypothetical protein|nr:hypothetical protein [Gemmatimonadaceae bacterium]
MQSPSLGQLGPAVDSAAIVAMTAPTVEHVVTCAALVAGAMTLALMIAVVYRVIKILN